MGSETIRHARLAVRAAESAERAARQALEYAQQAWSDAGTAKREAEIVLAMLEHEATDGS